MRQGPSSLPVSSTCKLAAAGWDWGHMQMERVARTAWTFLTWAPAALLFVTLKALQEKTHGPTFVLHE